MHTLRNFHAANQFCLQPRVWSKRGAHTVKELRAVLGRTTPCGWLTLLRRGATARNQLQHRAGHAFTHVLHALCVHGRTKHPSSLGINTYTPWRANSAQLHGARGGRARRARAHQNFCAHRNNAYTFCHEGAMSNNSSR